MRPVIKRASIAIGVAVAAVLAIRATTFVWAGGVLRAYVSAHAAEVAARRAAHDAVRLPAMRGTPRDVPCYEEQRTFFGSSALGDPAFDPWTSMDDWPATHVPTDARAFLTKHAQDVAGLRATLDCTRPADSDASASESFRVSLAADVLIIDGEIRAEDGDLDAALDEEIDAVRLAEELDPIAGAHCLAEAALTIARVLARSKSNDIVDRADRALTKLAPFVPTSARQLESVKDLVFDVADQPDGGQIDPIDSWKYDGAGVWGRSRMRAMMLLLPTRAIVARGVLEIDADIDREILAAKSGDNERVHQTEDAIFASQQTTWNPLVWSVCPAALLAPARTVDRGACAFAVARAAIVLERGRSASGIYSGDAVMPADPCGAGAPVRLQLIADGAGYRVWSVGANGKDDRGVGRSLAHEDAPDDLMAQRSPDVR